MLSIIPNTIKKVLYSSFTFLGTGTHLAFQFSKTDNKPLPTLEKCTNTYTLKAFQKPLQSPSHFSKVITEPISLFKSHYRAHLTFQKSLKSPSHFSKAITEPISLFKSHYRAHLTFQKPLQSPSHFSKAITEPVSFFKNYEKIPLYSRKKGIVTL